MRQPELQTTAPLDPDPQWPQGYIDALRLAGAQEKNIPYCVSWVRRFFARYPNRPRRELGRGEIEGFLSEIARSPGVSNWMVQQARNAIETYYERFRGIPLTPRTDREGLPSSAPSASSECGIDPVPRSSSPTITTAGYFKLHPNVKPAQTVPTPVGQSDSKMLMPVGSSPSAITPPSVRGDAPASASRVPGATERMAGAAPRAHPGSCGGGCTEAPSVATGLNWGVLENHVRDCLRVEHYSYSTEQTYVAWIKRFVAFNNWRKPSTLEAEHVRAFLSDLAVKQQVASSTQNQALNAVVFLYRKVIKKDIGDFGDFPRARMGLRLPVIASRTEVRL